MQIYKIDHFTSYIELIAEAPTLEKAVDFVNDQLLSHTNCTSDMIYDISLDAFQNICCYALPPIIKTITSDVQYNDIYVITR